MSECVACEGSRHVLKNGVWVKCGCLKKDKLKQRYERAGVPARFIVETWTSFLDRYSVTNGSKKALLTQAKTLKNGGRMSEWLVIHGHPRTGKSLAAALLLKAACSGGLSCFNATVPMLVDGMFDRNEENVPEGFESMPFLVVLAGNEPKHSYNAYALEKLLGDRWARDLSTVLVSAVDASRLSGVYGSANLGEMLASNFTQVWIGPKESCGTAK